MIRPKKIHLLILFCFAAVLALSGCAGEKAADNNAGDQNRDAGTQNADARRADRGITGMPDGNFTAASSTDLAVGEKIMVMGTANADGSIAAAQIIIGNADTDFSTSTFFRAFAGPGMATGTDSDLPDRQAEPDGDMEQRRRDWQERTGGEMPDFSRFGNMTDEERQQTRERMMATGGGAGGVTGGARQIVRGTNGGASRLSGEIIDLDAISLTLKLDEGGSKLIFYSPSTRINMIKDNPEFTGPDSPPPPSATPSEAPTEQ